MIQITMTAFSIADTIIVGKLLGEKALAAISFASPIFMLITILMEVIAIGGSDIVCREKGEGKQDIANRHYSAIIQLSVACGVVLLVVGSVFIRQIVYLFGARGELVSWTIQYFQLMLFYAPVVLLYICLSCFARDSGQELAANVANLVSCGLNIVLDIYFVGFTKWGIAGAPLASIIGSGFGVFILLISYYTHEKSFHFRMKISISDWLSILRHGSVSAFRYANAMIITIIFNNNLMLYMGEAGVVAYTITMGIFLMAIDLIESVRDTSQPMISTFYGEQNNEAIRQTMKKAFMSAMVMSFVIVILIQLFPSQIGRFYGVTDQATIKMVVSGLRIYSLALFWAAWNETIIYYYMYVGRQKLMLLLSVLRSLVFVVPCVGLLIMFGMRAMWTGLVIAEGLTALSVVLYTKIIEKRTHHGIGGMLLLGNELDDSSFYVSNIQNEKELMNSIKEIEMFLHKKNVSDKVAMRVSLVIEEHGCNAIEHNGENKEFYLDVFVLLKDAVMVSICDNGRFFDINRKNREDEKLGSAILRGVSKDLQSIPELGLNRLNSKIE
jgi:putative MATE family efflux protein